MMKEEFEKIIGTEIALEDYKILEEVYTWHPAIPSTDGKQKIADIYKAGGMAAIMGMYSIVPICKKIHEELTFIENEKVSHLAYLEHLSMERDRLFNLLKNIEDGKEVTKKDINRT